MRTCDLDLTPGGAAISSTIGAEAARSILAIDRMDAFFSGPWSPTRLHLSDRA
jgi:hypothetical protein